MSSSSSNSFSQSLQSTNCLNSANDDAGDVVNNNTAGTGTYPFTQSSIASTQNNDAGSDPSHSSTIQKTTNASSSTVARKSSRQVTPSAKRSSQLSIYKEKMYESKQKRQKISSVVKTTLKHKQTTMTQCVPFHVSVNNQSSTTPTPSPPKTTTKETKITIMKNASSHKKQNRIFVGASVYSRSVGTELEPLQPGKKKRLRKAMFGKVVESMENNTYKVLFSNNTYITLKSSQLTRAPEDHTFASKLKSATRSDINDIYDKAEDNNDMSMVDCVHP